MEKNKTASGAEVKQPTIAGMSRRAFAAGCVGTAATLALGGVKAIPAQAVVRPPGGQDEDHLLAACIRCEKCYEVCPQKAISLANWEDGVLNMRTPKMDFDSSYCDFCTESNNGKPKCVEVCPTNALQLVENAKAETTIIGVAKINTSWCLAYNLRFCRSCYDACPYDAIELEVDENDANRPVVKEDVCNGCGACEAACISMKAGSLAATSAKDRAILVKPVKG